MKEIVAKIFGKETAEDQEIVAFYEDVQKLAMEEYAIEYHQKQVKDNEVLDLVIHPLHISDFHIGFKYEELQMDKERYLNKGMVWLRKEYGFHSPRLHKMNELIDSGKLRHCNDV